jgi:methylenetetrahydrofolate dehydrogenase (NADP+)/methenyltetrahydrofolate cyclohydrolase
MGKIVDGKRIAEGILTDLKKRVAVLKEKNIQPALAVVIVGNDQPSHTYVKKKGEAAEEIGLAFFKYEISAETDKETLIARLKEIQAEHELSGLILQLPVPESLWPYTREIVNHIKIEIDVDCLSHTALGRVMMGESPLNPPTPSAMLEVLKYHQIDLTGKEVCIVGRGSLIGKPLAAILNNQPVTLVTCGKSTPDLSVYTKKADVIFSGVGKKDLITGEMIKEGAIVIDAGVCFDRPTGSSQDKMYGDIDFESVSKKAALVTPTPGGIGPITVAKLLENTVRVAEASE